MLEDESSSYMRDINGSGASNALKDTGWIYQGEPLCVPIVEDAGQRAVAAAWLTKTSMGLNLSFATAQRYAGQGFSTLACALVLVAYRNMHPDAELLVHAQFDSENHGSLGVVNHLGLVQSDDFKFSVSSRGALREFYGAKAPISDLMPKARDIIRSRVYLREEVASRRSTERE